MKKALAMTAVLALSLGMLASAAPAVKEEITAAAGTPTVDGTIGADEWSAAEELVITSENAKVTNGDGSTPGIEKAVYKFQWDEEFLYLLEVRTDTALEFAAGDEQLFLSDSTLFFISRDGISDVKDRLDFQYTARKTEDEGAYIVYRTDEAGQVYTTEGLKSQVAATVDGNTATIEAKLAWSEMKDVTPGDNVKVRVGIIDSDTNPTGKGTKFGGQLEWCWTANGTDLDKTAAVLTLAPAGGEGNAPAANPETGVAPAGAGALLLAAAAGAVVWIARRKK